MTERPGSRTNNSILLDLYQEVARMSVKIDQLMADREAASSDRRELNLRLSGIERELHEYKITKAEVDRLTPIVNDLDKRSEQAIAEVNRLTPIVNTLDKRNEQATGAMWALKAQWAAFGGIGGIIAYFLSELGHRFIK